MPACAVVPVEQSVPPGAAWLADPEADQAPHEGSPRCCAASAQAELCQELFISDRYGAPERRRCLAELET